MRLEVYRGSSQSANTSSQPDAFPGVSRRSHPGNLLAQAVPHAAQIHLLIERYRRCVPLATDASRLRVLSDRLLALTFWLEERSKIK